MFDEFQIVVIEGLVYDDEGVIRIRSEEGSESLTEKLLPLEDRKVRATFQHWPPDPPDGSRWGGGSCFWEPSGSCPFGHHTEPRDLYAESFTGTLSRDGDSWVVDSSTVRVDWLVGHQCRIIVVTEFTPPKDAGFNISDFGPLQDKLEEIQRALSKITGE